MCILLAQVGNYLQMFKRFIEADLHWFPHRIELLFCLPVLLPAIPGIAFPDEPQTPGLRAVQNLRQPSLVSQESLNRSIIFNAQPQVSYGSRLFIFHEMARHRGRLPWAR
jgi:hypothetical protein